MKKGIVILFVLVSCFSSSCVFVSCSDNGSKKVENLPSVRLDSALACGMGTTQQYPGKVVSSDDANISFKVAGTLRVVSVKEGQHVKKGQLLAELDNTDYKVQLSATEAEYSQIKAEAERVISLYEDGGTTASNYDKARYGLQQIEAKLENHRNQLSYTRIYAPYDGFVQKLFMKRGETVGAGMPVVSMLSSAAPEVEINLPASAYVNRDNFTKFSCSFDVLPGRTIEADPISVLQQANSNQLYTMRLKLKENDASVSPGMSTWVTIYGRNGDGGVVRIPTTSVLERNGKSSVFVYNVSTQKVKEITVEVESLHTDGTVEVRGGVNPADMVVSSGVHHIKDGQKVKPLQPVSKTNVGGLL